MVSDALTSETVVGLRSEEYAQPCTKVTKLRSEGRLGIGHWGSWCPIHHHWLNDKPAKDLVDAELEALKP